MGAEHGVGRADVVEDRVVGIKSRGVYETPGGTILLAALQELEQLVLSRRSLALKDDLAPRYADVVYEGRWWTPEREAMDAMVDSLMAPVTGEVRLRLFKGQAAVLARSSPMSLYDLDLASFGASEGYAHADSSGFVKLFGLPLRAVAAQQGRHVVERPEPEKGEADSCAADVRVPDAVSGGASATESHGLGRSVRPPAGPGLHVRFGAARWREGSPRPWRSSTDPWTWIGDCGLTTCAEAAHGCAAEGGGRPEGGRGAAPGRGARAGCRQLKALPGPQDLPDEDVHSLIERLLVEAVGPVGGKLHRGARATTRSRPPFGSGQRTRSGTCRGLPRPHDRVVARPGKGRRRSRHAGIHAPPAEPSR